MPPGGGGCKRRCTVQDHPPATVRRDEVALPHSTPLFPAIFPEEKPHEQEQQEQQQPAASLPEGPLVEILARVPYRSLCRFKCVSKPWLALCSSRDIIKRSPQTLSGFFYVRRQLKFCNLSGRGPPLVDPSLSFLRESYHYIRVKQLCGGLLLCICSTALSMPGESDYVVCNPATEEWTVLPHILSPDQDSSPAYLGFDPAVPSRFVVFALLTGGENDFGDVAIYSSETRQWAYVQSKWVSGTPLDLDHSSQTRVFLNGTMHWPTFHNSIFTVDSEGRVWREIRMPDVLPDCFDPLSIGQSQGCLWAWQQNNRHDCLLYIWVLEDYGTEKWIRRHTIIVLELFGQHYRKDDKYYRMIAVHPDCNVIFLTDRKTTLSYDLDNQKMNVICNRSIYGRLAYTPCFAEWS